MIVIFRNITRILVLLILALSSVMAGDAGTESPFTAGAGARALGMGGGFVSTADDGSTVFYNPAGLGIVQQQEATFMHMTLFEGSQYNFASWVYPTLKMGGFGLGLMRIGTGDIIGRRNYVETNSFDFSTLQMMMSYGHRIHEQIAIGLSLKMLNQKMDTYSDYGLGVDFGLLGELNKQFTVGVIARDVIPAEIKLVTSKESVPTSIAGGIAYHNLFYDGYLSLIASFELEKIENRSTRIHSGIETLFDSTYALRLGYDSDNLSLGAGYRHGRLRVDYAYKFVNYIADSHRFSLSFMLGETIAEQREKRIETDQQAGSILLSDERRRQFQFFTDKAYDHYRQNQLDSALSYYHRALAFDEKNETIIGIIAAIEETLQVQQQQRQQITRAEVELTTSVNNYLIQARNFFTKKYYPAALDMLDLILDIRPKHDDALTLKKDIERAINEEIQTNLQTADQAEKEGHFVVAIGAYNRILELDPDNQEIKQAREHLGARLDLAHQLNLGIESYRNGRYDDATARFRAVLAVNPEDPVALEYLRRMQRTPEAASTLEDLQKNRAIWQLYLDGLRFMRDKEYKKAIEVWEKVIRAYPNNAETRNNLEQARLRLKLEESR